MSAESEVDGNSFTKTFIQEVIEVAIGIITKPNLLNKDTLIKMFKATDMIDAYCKKNKIKQKPVYSTPMEGFDPTLVDKILGLKERGLRSVVLLPLGHRDSTGDWLLNMPKVRKARETMVTVVD